MVVLALALPLAVMSAGCGSSTSAVSTVPETALLPTVRCSVTAGIDGLKYPKWPKEQRVRVPHELAGTLSVYVGGFERVVAPSGWRCHAIAAANGGTLLSAAPAGTDPVEGVKVWTEPACVGCIYDETCGYFGKRAAPLSVGLPCPGVPDARHLTRVSSTLVRYRDDDGEVGMVSLHVADPRAAGVSCLVSAKGTCAVVLADWLAH